MITHNDIIRRIRFIFDFGDSRMMELFALGGQTVTRAEVSSWLKKDGDSGFVKITDHQLAIFLNGLIVKNRGKREGAEPVAESRLNNNIIFRKLRIALNLKDEDILSTLELAGMRVSRHELSAFFRNPSQPQYRPCNDQILRNFLAGLQLKHRK